MYQFSYRYSGKNAYWDENTSVFGYIQSTFIFSYISLRFLRFLTFNYERLPFVR